MSEAQWERIRDALPGRLEHVGRTAADNRQFIHGVLWVLRPGARWHDLPERYGQYKSVHMRLCAGRGRVAGYLRRLIGGQEERYLMIDSIIVRAHQQVAAGRKKGAPRTRLWGVPKVD